MKSLSMLLIQIVLIVCFSGGLRANAQEKVQGRHVIVYHEPGRFAGWPANNAAGIFPDDEIVTGFIEGAVQLGEGHNLADDYSNWLARSLDGGLTWTCHDPEGYVGDYGDQPELMKLTQPIDFLSSGFIMRVVGAGYHGASDPRAHFFWSADRGSTWKGPFVFSGLDLSEVTGTYGLCELTPRTDYILLGERECMLFFSAREKGVFGSDRLFCIRTTDGGISFEFQGWIIKPHDPEDSSDTLKAKLYDDGAGNPFASECRAVMASSLASDDGTLFSAVRRKYMVNGGADRHWIDLYVSSDRGKSWDFRSWVCDTGPGNGNPPALEYTPDGSLCVVYGNRRTGTIEVRYSADRGSTWSDPKILMDGFWSEDMEFNDLGYPKLFRRSDGQMVALFYYSTLEHPHHLHACIWNSKEQ